MTYDIDDVIDEARELLRFPGCNIETIAKTLEKKYKVPYKKALKVVNEECAELDRADDEKARHEGETF